jgi:hypothetical protein
MTDISLQKTAKTARSGRQFQKGQSSNAAGRPGVRSTKAALLVAWTGSRRRAAKIILALLPDTVGLRFDWPRDIAAGPCRRIASDPRFIHHARL